MSIGRLPYPMFDADNHLYEPQEALTKFLPEKYKNVDPVRAGQRPHQDRASAARSANTSRTRPSDVVAARAPWRSTSRTATPTARASARLFGEPMQVAMPAFREPAPRLELMDELQIDRTLMFPTLASLIEERMRDDPVVIHAVVHSLNQWLYEIWGFNYEDRIFTIPVITLADRRKGHRGTGVVRRARRQGHPGPSRTGPRLPRTPVVRPARVRPVLEARRRATTCWSPMHSVRQRLLPLHLRVGRHRPGDAAVPDQRDVASSTNGVRSRTRWPRG